MGLNNFTTGNSGNGNTPPSGGAGSNPPPMPSMASMTGSMDDITDILLNYNDRFKNAGATLFRDDVITQTISVIIGKNKPNALLVGAAGVGKTKIVEDIARRIANDDPLIPKNLKGHTIYELPLSSLVAGAGIVGQLEERVTALVDFICDPKNKAILFIDEIHQLTTDRSSTYEKIAQIIKPALARGDMHVIGATTLQESRSFDDDPAFNRRFSRLIVDELNREQTLEILLAARAGLTSHYKHQITVTDDVLATVTAVADEYAKAGHHRPDNALTLLDRAMADTVLDFNKRLAEATATQNTAAIAMLNATATIPTTERRVRQVAMRLMTGHAQKESLNVQQLSQELSRIQGQDSITEKLVETLHRDDLGVFPRTTPLAWLFAGASGVGKTEIAKIIAKELTGQPPIILNMTEYHSPAAINRIIGAPAGYVGSTSNAELPFDCLESNPYRVILLDEIEKSDQSVQRLFLSAFDEGYIRTSQGKAVDFSKAIVIATTNAAKETMSTKFAGFGARNVPTHGNLVRDLEQHFDTEFLARFSEIVGFNPLNADVYREILQGSYVRERELICKNQPRKAALLPGTIPEDELYRLAETTYLESQGARPAIRTARRHIEDTLLHAALNAKSASQAWPAAGPSEESTDDAESAADGTTEAGAATEHTEEYSDSHR
ncbi:ATP-dependent Clp protease ATP-binding subunit ClpA [Arthrobacter sp. UYNi723]